jgi:heavy metal sensor kinase
MTLRTRLTVWYSLVLLAVITVSAVVVAWQLERIGLRRVDRELDAVTSTLSNVLRDELHETGDAKAAADEARELVGAPGHAIAVFTANGERLGTTADPFSIPIRPEDASAPRQLIVHSPPDDWRVHVQPATIDGRTLVLVTGISLADVMREQREAREAIMVGIPIMLLLAIAGGLWIASVGLRPIAAMAERAASIPLTGADDLGHSDRTDELGVLARAFNGLVARLRTALQTQRQFMADASHELRTPLSVIRSAADVTLSRAHRDEPEYREALTIAGDEAKRVGRLVEDMLVLARADAGGYPLRPVDLYLDELVSECRSAASVLGAERGVTVSSHGPADITFVGDEDLLRRMLLNVLRNAVQHSRPHGLVAVDVVPNGVSIAIRVSDAGTGIAEGDRDRIFDRFVQLDPSRRGQGTGLGLPIARWIAEAHHGTLVLERSGAGGSTFCLSLPI